MTIPTARRFKVSLPTVLLLEGGQERVRLDGLITEEDLERTFARAAAA